MSGLNIVKLAVAQRVTTHDDGVVLDAENNQTAVRRVGECAVVCCEVIKVDLSAALPFEAPILTEIFQHLLI